MLGGHKYMRLDSAPSNVGLSMVTYALPLTSCVPMQAAGSSTRPVQAERSAAIGFEHEHRATSSTMHRTLQATYRRAVASKCVRPRALCRAPAPRDWRPPTICRGQVGQKTSIGIPRATLKPNAQNVCVPPGARAGGGAPVAVTAHEAFSRGPSDHARMIPWVIAHSRRRAPSGMPKSVIEPMKTLTEWATLTRPITRASM